MSKLIEPETERLVLRQWLPSDRTPFAELNADSRVMEYYPRPLTRKESDAMADKIEGLISERGWGFWAIERKSDETFLGFTGLHIPSYELPFSPCIEIGWRLAYPYWGSGYATEAARAALETGFNLLGFDQIVSFATLRNHRSRAVMERLGMYDTKNDFLHPEVPADSGLQQHCLYLITRTEWNEGNIHER